MELQSVGLREFRTHLHKYTRQSQEPLVITSHGEAIGYYIPAKPAPQAQDFTALLEAARKIASLLAAAGVDDDEIVADFQEINARDTDA